MHGHSAQYRLEFDENLHSTVYVITPVESWPSRPDGCLKECSMSAGKPVKAAFEIKKGTWQVMTLSETEVEKHLDLQELLDGLEDGFRGLELGEIQSPPRPE